MSEGGYIVIGILLFWLMGWFWYANSVMNSIDRMKELNNPERPFKDSADRWPPYGL